MHSEACAPPPLRIGGGGFHPETPRGGNFFIPRTYEQTESRVPPSGGWARLLRPRRRSRDPAARLGARCIFTAAQRLAQGKAGQAGDMVLLWPLGRPRAPGGAVGRRPAGPPRPTTGGGGPFTILPLMSLSHLLRAWRRGKRCREDRDQHRLRPPRAHGTSRPPTGQ